MGVMSGGANRTAPDTAAAEPNRQPSGALRRNGPNGALASDAPREWLLTGADELFRGIYTRAGIGASEVVAVCSAIAGEGKTAISLGLGVTLAQDFPERRVLLVETDFQRPGLA